MTTPAHVARAWSDAVAGTSFVPLRPSEMQALLLAHVGRLAGVAESVPFDPTPAREVGAALVGAHFTSTETLSRSLDVLARHLPGLVGVYPFEDLPARLQCTLAGFATGFAEALREATVVEQEEIGRAALIAGRAAERRLLASEERFRAVFTAAAIGIGIADLAGRIIEVNPALARLFGYSAADFDALNVNDLVHPDDAPSVWRLYEELVDGRRDEFHAEKRFFRADGSVIWTNLSVSLVRDEQGAPLHQVAMIEDVTERRQLQASLHHLAYHDPLTGLPNRAMFAERLAAAFAGPPGPGRVGICLLDLDGFKRINDSLGHQLGDELLVIVAARLARTCGPHLVARMSGDEFVVLTERTGTAELTDLAGRVLAALSEPIRAHDHELRVTASVGVVAMSAADSTPAAFMSAADITLYRAKREGKGRYEVYDRDHTEREMARSTVSSSLHAAIDQREFFLEYQPLVALSGRVPGGVEALVRWRHPTLGLIGPDQFIGLAEETGAIVSLGRWVLREACTQACAWRAEFGDRAPMMSVNVAPRQLEDPGLVGEVAAALAETGLDPRHLQLELTERALMREEDGPLDALVALDRMGVRVVIDDFGTGYSNLSSLSRLPVHGLKLDGSFLARMSRDDDLILSTLVTLARGLGLTVTAEGVETAFQLARVQALGVDLGQGWFFARPGGPEVIAEGLRAAVARTAG